MKNNRVAIVTGASRGIGRATAIRLANDFSAIVLVARNASTLAESASLIGDMGTQTLCINIDLRLPNSANLVVEHALNAFGQIDALVNIAGDVPQLDLFSMTDEQWNEGMALKFHAARKLTIQAWDALKASRGSVVFMSGNSAVAPKAAFAAVASINAAIIALGKTFAERGLQDGVQVNSVLPGAVMTERREVFFEKWSIASGVSAQDAKARFLGDAGIARYGQPEDIAELIAFLVSPASNWMTGSALRMDGGEIKTI